MAALMELTHHHGILTCDILVALLCCSALAESKAAPAQVALIGAGGRLAIAARGAVLLRTVGAQQQQPSLASLVGALSLDGAPRGAAARLQRSALAFPPPASDAPAHSHFRPPWAERGAAAGLPLHAQAARIAVPLREEHIGRHAACFHAQNFALSLSSSDTRMIFLCDEHAGLSDMRSQ